MYVLLSGEHPFSNTNAPEKTETFLKNMKDPVWHDKLSCSEYFSQLAAVGYDEKIK